MFFGLAVCLVQASASFAAVRQIVTPAGLAVDASGNLYVANFGRNDILIYNSSFVQETAKTITNGIAGPQGVAFDQYGNLWVSNFNASNGGSNGSITEYTNRVLQTSNTITNDVQGPLSIAFDGLNNLWVDQNELGVDIYSPLHAYAPPSNLAQTFDNGEIIQAIGLSGGQVAFGTPTYVHVSSSSVFLETGTEDGNGFSLDSFAFGKDNKNNIYFTSDVNHILYIVSPNNTAVPLVSPLPFTGTCRGIAIDNARGRIYVSDEVGNQIFVFDKTGAVITTIHN